MTLAALSEQLERERGRYQRAMLAAIPASAADRDALMDDHIAAMRELEAEAADPRDDLAAAGLLYAGREADTWASLAPDDDPRALGL